MKTRLNNDGIVTNDTRLKAFTVSKANENPPKRIKQIENLLNTKRPSICVVRGEGIGDVLMTTPTVNALYNKFNGNIDIIYATNTQYLGGALTKTLQGNTQISKIIDRMNLVESDFDAVINLHCPAIMHEKPMAPPINRIDLFARHAGLYPLADTKPKLFLTDEEKTNAGYFLDSLGLHNAKYKIILVSLFSSSPNRSLNREVIYQSLKQLGDLGYKLILVSHETDHEKLGSYYDIRNVFSAKNLDIRQLSALLTQIDLLLCPDSALLHCAGALDISTVALFGPTDPRARVNYYPHAKALWGGEGINGHPHWYEPCPFNNICWNNFRADEIVEAVKNKIEHIQKQSSASFGSVI